MATNTTKLLIGAAVVGGAALYAVKDAQAKAKQVDRIDPATGTPIPAQLPPDREHGEMSEALKQRVAAALVGLKIHPFTGNPTGPVPPKAIIEATTLIGLLEAQRFNTAAQQMRGFVTLAQQYTPTPADAAPIAQATPPGLSPSMREYITRVLTMERNPRVLGTFKNWLATLPPTPERDSMIKMTEALIVQIQAAISTTAAIDTAAAVQNATTPEQLAAAVANGNNISPTPAPVSPPPRPPAPLPRPSPTTTTSPGWPQPAATIPPRPGSTATATAALPDSPAVVPSTPAPQPVPPPLNPAQIAARAMNADIKRVQGLHGGPTAAAKRAFNRSLAKKFQSLSGAKVDGLPGPSTYLRAASIGATDLPLVMYWSRRTGRADVPVYRRKLREFADNYTAKGRTGDANRLRMTAELERGQGGIPGGPYAS